jgi:hypothetical protein
MTLVTPDRHHLYRTTDIDRRSADAADQQRDHRPARALDLLDQPRVASPRRSGAAKRINEETERIVERAQRRPSASSPGPRYTAFLIEDRELTRVAELRSAEIIADGQREAAESRRGADEYAQSVLVKLEGECIRALQSIKRGLALLDERHVDERDGADVDDGDVAETVETSRAEGTRAQL